MRRVSLIQLVQYGLAMAVGTGLDVTCVTLLRHVSGVPLVVAVATGFLANVASGYLLSKHVVFRAATVPPGRSLWRYAVLVALNVLVAVVGVAVLVSAGWPYLLGRLLSTAVLVPINFLVMRSWVFALVP